MAFQNFQTQICLMEHFWKPESVFCYWDIPNLWVSELFLDLGQEEFLQSIKPVASFSGVTKLMDKKLRRSPTKSPTKKGKLILNEFDETKVIFDYY